MVFYKASKRFFLRPSEVLLKVFIRTSKGFLEVLRHDTFQHRFGDETASAIRKSKAKRTSNHWFLKVFGGPRPSKTVPEGSRRLPRRYLGLLGTILSHLGAILETRAFKIAPASWDCAR
jgi:hypothetical protein